MLRTSRRLPALIAIVALVGAACGTATPSASRAPGASTASQPPATSGTGEVVEIRWYCCLGTGEDPEAQIPVEKKVVEEFNASHPNIRLTFEVVTYDNAANTLATQIASGNGPDIAGPVGVSGAEGFHDQWLDLGDLIEKNSYDLSQFAEDAVGIYRTGDTGQAAIPFAIYPSALFYKPSLFEEAGLEEPPHGYGEKYVLDGQEVEWNYDTLREVALRLTVDKSGKDARDPAFNPKQIAQYGFEPQRDDLRGLGAYFGSGSLVAPDGKTAKVPEVWADAWKFFYDGTWDDHITMTYPVFQSDAFGAGEYAFFSGKVAMSENFLWATYGLSDDWDVAAIPTHNGQATSALNADTFRIFKGSKHPDEAFEVLRYLLDDASDVLLAAYSGMPARPDKQDAFFDGQAEAFPDTEVDWEVFKAGLDHADNPNFEAFMPHYNESDTTVDKFLTRWGTQPNLNIDAEIKTMEDQLTQIWAR